MSRKYFRTAVLESNPTDLESGVARLSFASELPVLRKEKGGGYWEVLSHDPGDANLGLLNRQGVVLENHDDSQQIGEVERNSAKVDADKKTRATINVENKHWRGEMRLKATEIPVSVGYIRLSLLSETPGSDNIPVRRFSWQPYEISLLTGQPADSTVGINRMKKRPCPDCDGTGRMDVDDDADDDEIAHAEKSEDGRMRCRSCRGNGYFTSARSKKVDLDEPLNADALLQNLTPEQKQAMRLLLDPKPNDGGTTITAVELESKVAEARSKGVTETQTAERARVKEITLATQEFVEKHGGKNKGAARKEIEKFATEAIEKGTIPAEFNARAMQYIVNADPATVDIRDIVPGEELSQFSLIRALNSAMENAKRGSGAPTPDPKTLEGDIIKTYDDKCRQSDGGRGYNPEGFVIPPHAPFGIASLSRADARSMFRKLSNRYGRDMQATVFGAGGAAVPTLLLLPVIELLRNKSVLNRVGVRTMGGLTGNVVIPRLEAPSTAYSVAEIAAITASQQVLGQVAMTPKRVGNQVTVSKQLVIQSSPDIEALIRDDMMEVLALKKDALGINGQGAASEPQGLFNTPGIGVVHFGGAATYAKIVEFQTDIRKNNVMGRLAYASTSATKGTLKTTAVALTGATVVASGEQNALWHERANSTGDEDGEMNGCQAIDSQQIPGDKVLAGVFDNLMEGIWGGLDVVVDPYSKAGNAEIVLTMNLWLDYAVRHPQAFSISDDAGNQ